MRTPDGETLYRFRITTILLYGGLAVSCFVILLPVADLPRAQRLWALALAACLAIWYWIGVIELGPAQPGVRHHLPVALLSSAILILLWYPLALIHQAFFLLLPGLFGHLYTNLSLRWASAWGVLLIAASLFRWLS